MRQMHPRPRLPQEYVPCPTAKSQKPISGALSRHPLLVCLPVAELRHALKVMPERCSAADVVSLVPAEDKPMLYWAFLFLIIGIIAAILGFGGIAGAAIGIAKVIFFIFIALFVLFLILGYTVFRRL
jgi:uncharacterized membrane protein YtjA (UPF0391 family)